MVSKPAARKVGFVSLGCPKALVDSERILTQLRQRQIADEQVGTYERQRLAAQKERELREAEAKYL